MDFRIMEDLTANSLSAQSITSGLDLLEDESTDDFGKLLLQNARDAQRMHDARNGNVRAFSRARPRRRGRLTLENLERDTSDKENAARGYAPGGSSPSVGSSDRSPEPPLNIPRDWGRKARSNHDWLKKLRLDDGVSAGQRVATGVRCTEPATNGVAVSHTAVQSGARSARTSPQVLQEWKLDEDFTAASLIVSTPAYPRNNILNDIRQRELEVLDEVSGLEDATDAYGVGKLPVRSGMKSGSSPARHAAEPNTTSPKPQAWRDLLYGLPSKNLQLQNQMTVERVKDDESIPHIVTLQNEGHRKPQTDMRAQNHDRTDSYDLLRKLSRAASGTPSPRSVVRRGDGESPEAAGRSEKLQTRPSQHVTDFPPKVQSDISPHPPPVLKQDEVDILLQNKEQEDPFHPVTPLPDDLVEDSKKQEQQYGKTPIVTGAWIDTPRTIKPDRSRTSPRKQQRSSPAKVEVEQPATQADKLTASGAPEKARALLNKPLLPASALEAIVLEARPQTADDDTFRSRDFAIGESTINSLEDILDSSLLDGDPDRLKAAISTLDEKTDTITLPLAFEQRTTKPRNLAERQRWKEMEQVARMNAQLRAARSNIRDARHGLRRFETAVLSSPETSRERKPSRASCPTCGCPGDASSTRSVTRSIASLFVMPAVDTHSTTEDSEGRERQPHCGWRRLTLLSIALLVGISYVLVELVLCDQFCQPRFAYSMKGYGVNYDAPKLPFVTLTLLFRPLKWLWKPAFTFIAPYVPMPLPGVDVSFEPSIAPTWKHMGKEEWEKLLATANETEIPWIEMLRKMRKPSLTAAAPKEDAPLGASWMESLKTQASQVWPDGVWSNMEDDEVL